MSDEIIKTEDNNISQEKEIPKIEEANPATQDARFAEGEFRETVEQKTEPVGEEIQPPNPLIRGNDTSTPTEPHPDPLLSNGEGEGEIQPPTTVSTSETSPLDAISLAFKANMMRARELLIKARMAIQIKKKKKLEKIMNLFLTKKKIDNSEVRDLLHVSDGTATNYLNILKKEGKIGQNGKGTGVYYTKI